MEQFAPAKGLEGFYAVSTFGNLRRVRPGPGTRCHRNFRPPSVGYHTARVCIDGAPFTVAVHRLVVETFIRPIQSHECVNHLDGNPLNNRLENLEITTASGNTQHAVDVLGWKPKSFPGETNGNAMMTAERAAYVKTATLPRGGIQRLAALWGVKRSTLYSIRAGRNWKHI